MQERRLSVSSRHDEHWDGLKELVLAAAAIATPGEELCVAGEGCACPCRSLHSCDAPNGAGVPVGHLTRRARVAEPTLVPG